MTSEACSPTGRATAPEDLATYVIGTVSSNDAAFARIVASLDGVPAVERKAALVKAVSDAGGSPWACAAFDAMWENQPASCSP